MALTLRTQSLLWLLAYFIPRYFLGSWIYTFEALFISAVFLAYRKDLRFAIKPRRALFFEVFFALWLGGLTRLGCSWLDIAFPFDFSSRDLAVLLLVVAPLLEEALFRQALLIPLEKLLPRRRGAVIAVSALFFSAGHLEALFTMPPELFGFVWYQGIYTMVLGVWFASAFYRYGGLLAPVLLHGAFNLGFYIADRF